MTRNLLEKESINKRQVGGKKREREKELMEEGEREREWKR